MDPNYEKRLEAEIDRVLKGLPELSAPRQLVLNVLAEIEQRLRIGDQFIAEILDRGEVLYSA